MSDRRAVAALLLAATCAGCFRAQQTVPAQTVRAAFPALRAEGTAEVTGWRGSMTLHLSDVTIWRGATLRDVLRVCPPGAPADTPPCSGVGVTRNRVDWGRTLGLWVPTVLAGAGLGAIGVCAFACDRPESTISAVSFGGLVVGGLVTVVILVASMRFAR